jgi:hypothetical protein
MRSRNGLLLLLLLRHLATLLYLLLLPFDAVRMVLTRMERVHRQKVLCDEMCPELELETCDKVVI